MRCPNCGADNPAGSRVCAYCGSGLPMDAAPAQAPPVQAAPPAQPQVVVVERPVYVDPPSSKDRKVALLLAIFLGAFGAHNFYVGKKGLGILYLCTAGLFYVGWIMDIYLIATGKFRDSNGFLLK